jgi:quercetin dioxygenase-like cupin family protein
LVSTAYSSFKDTTRSSVVRHGKLLRVTSFSWTGVAEERLNPLLSRRVIHGEKLTIARLQLSKGAAVRLHSHENEQVSMMESGSLRFVLDGQELIVNAGEGVRIPAHVPHSVEALEDSVVVDVFAPCREDWKRGDDAYLRT